MPNIGPNAPKGKLIASCKAQAMTNGQSLPPPGKENVPNNFHYRRKAGASRASMSGLS